MAGIEVFELARQWKEQAEKEREQNAKTTGDFLNWSIEMQGSVYTDEFILWLVGRYPNYKDEFDFEDVRLVDMYDLYLHFNPF